MAISWLVPRLSRFHDQEIGIDVELHTRLSTIELGGGAADIGLLYGHGRWPELVSQRLLELRACIACTPRLRAALPVSAS